ncbi:AEC family transporter [Leucobacter komagatae]|uniref:Membrane protein n=1 Tax=Leucobacter komagatae TaxID=55969 RepID=A0A0D0II29_9MICO|nr:AEC family transporter [Leucobacter komagatae]KIP51334.1 membrane protein [Leucobacter komagatae]
MLDALTGFVVVGFAIFIGWILGRTGALDAHARGVLSTLVFWVLSPALLFTVLAQAEVSVLFSSLLPVSASAALAVIGVYAAVARFIWRRPAGEALIGALAAGQVNANNIGIPLSLYILGSAAYPAPVVLFQLLVLTPVTLSILEVTAGGPFRLSSIGRALTNPIIIGSALGVAVSASGITLPTMVFAPIELIANACVPVLLISFGVSLHGQRVLSEAGSRAEVFLASGLKLLVMPALAWLAATYVFGLDSAEVLIVVVLAALPSAQNVFNYAQHFGVGEVVARDTVFITTVGCIPILFLATVLLG